MIDCIYDCLRLRFGLNVCLKDCKSTENKEKSDKHENHDQDKSGSAQAAPEASKENTCGLRRTDKKKLGVNGMGRVVGGVDAEPFEFPWQVTLQMFIPKKKKMEHICGGAIINEHWILTAAHCLELLKGKEKLILIKVGSNDVNDNKTPNYTADHFVFHPGWVMKFQTNDIALIKTKEKIHFKTNNKKQYEVNSVCLPKEDSEVKGTLTLSGFGRTNANAEQADYLQKVVVPIYDRNKCAENYKKHIIVNEMKICAGGRGGRDSCLGDSGGPLVKTNRERVEIVGVVSFGYPCAVRAMPTIYTKISKYVNWIIEQVEGTTED